MLDLLQAYLLFLLLVSNYSALSLTPAPKEGCVHCLPPHPPLYFMVRSSVTFHDDKSNGYFSAFLLIN